METTIMTNYRSGLLLFFHRYLRKLCTVDVVNIWLLTTYWSQNSMVLGDGYKLKIPPSQLVYLYLPKIACGGIFCVLAKAVDCVNHEMFLATLHFYGIWGVFEDWFKSHITNRRQKVGVNHLIQLKFCSLAGVHWNMEFPKDQF